MSAILQIENKHKNAKKPGKTGLLRQIIWDLYQGVQFSEIGLWQDEYDPNCPTEIIVDVGVVEKYEFNYAAIQKWLPWVKIV